jgi:hypothetical protein
MDENSSTPGNKMSKGGKNHGNSGEHIDRKETGYY